MNTNETELLGQAVEKTQSDLILFFVILLVALVSVLLPLYTLITKDRKEKHKLDSERQNKYIEREKRIIQVITANTDVMASLKAALESNGIATASAIEQINIKFKSIDEKLGKLFTESAKTNFSIERLLSNQVKIEQTVSKTLLIVDSIPNDSNFGLRRQDL